MRVRQWEDWKAKPDAFENEHWFVIISGQERLDAPIYHQVNGLVIVDQLGSLAHQPFVPGGTINSVPIVP